MTDKYELKTKDGGKDEDDEAILEEMKGNVKKWLDWFSENNKVYKDMMSLIYSGTVSESEKQRLKAVDKPDVEINYLSVYADRLIGEFTQQTPAVSVSGEESQGNKKPISSDVVDIVEGNLMKILDNYDKYSKDCVIKQQCVGGFSALKVWTDYRNEHTHEQDIFIGDVDPTLCFFDTLAKTPSKADGEFSGELYPMSEKSFKRKYPKHADCIDRKSFDGGNDFQWFFNDGREKVVVLCDYYCKKYKSYELLQLSDGSSISRKDYNKMKKEWSSIDPIHSVISRRYSEEYDIMRYVFFGDEIIKKEKLKYPKLPYFFVDGNSGRVYEGYSERNRQVTKSYLKNGVGPQKLLNSSAQTVADSIQNLMRSKMLIEKRAVVDPESWKNIHRVGHLQWNSLDAAGNPTVPKPEPIVQPSPPAVVMETFSNMPNVMQNSLGTYDAQLGISDKQLSGVAIEKGATQNNAASMPYAKNYMLSLTDAIDFVVKLMPSLYPTGATLPVLDKEGNHGYKQINKISPDGSFDVNYPVINYGKNDLNVNVKADYSFELQKDRAIKTMVTMMSVSDSFKQVMESPKGMDAFLDNLDMRSVDKIREAHQEMVEQAQNKPKEPNPIEQQMQLKQQQLMLDKQELQQKQQKDMMDAQFKQQKMELERQEMQSKMRMEMLELRQASVNNRLAEQRIGAEIKTHNVDNATKLVEQAMKKEDQELKYAEQVLKHEDQQHRHTMDIAKHVGIRHTDAPQTQT